MKVYIASPYTIGDVAINVRNQLETANILMDLNFYPYVPLMTHFQHMFFPRPYAEWLKVDLEWISVCDCLLRLEGESKGADREVLYAQEIGKPVFYSIQNLVNHFNQKNIN